MMAAPLMAAADLRDASDSTLRILTNREVIAVDQDAAAQRATRGPIEATVPSHGAAMFRVERKGGNS